MRPFYYLSEKSSYFKNIDEHYRQDEIIENFLKTSEDYFSLSMEELQSLLVSKNS